MRTSLARSSSSVSLPLGWGATAKAHQPQRGDMFIARPNRNLRKPRRGGMVSSRTGHAAPTGLAEKIGGVAVAINMSLLRSWPNPAYALDGWIPSLLIAGHDRPAASDVQGWAGGTTAKAHQPQRGDMFIARPNRNLRKPRRGGMLLSRTGHAAPTGLAEKIGGVAVAINMSLLRSWPNPAHALDGWIPSLLIAGHDRPAASDEHRSTSPLPT